MKKIFIPTNPKNIKQKEISRFLQNIEEEIASNLFTQNEISILQQPKLYGKYLNKKTRLFFLYHFLPLWEKSIKTIFIEKTYPIIIELGCGGGMSCFLFSLLGAETIGIDLNIKLINICKKRKIFYKNYTDQLKVNFHTKDVFNFRFQDYAPVDIFFSFFSFNLMKPYDTLLDHLIPSLKQGGRIIIIDGNTKSIYNHMVPSRRRKNLPSAEMIQKKLKTLGCKIISIETYCAIPSFVFRIPILRQFALKFENIIKKIGIHKFFGISYMIIAEKI